MAEEKNEEQQVEAKPGETKENGKDDAQFVEKISIGADVKITGVAKEPVLNGRMGKIRGYDEAKSRYIISINEDEFEGKSTSALPARFKGKEFKFLRDQLLVDGEEALTSVRVEAGKAVHEFKCNQKMYWKEAELMNWMGGLDIDDPESIEGIHCEDSTGVKKEFSAQDTSWTIPVDEMNFPLIFRVMMKKAPEAEKPLPAPLPASRAMLPGKLPSLPTTTMKKAAVGMSMEEMMMAQNQGASQAASDKSRSRSRSRSGKKAKRPKSRSRSRSRDRDRKKDKDKKKKDKKKDKKKRSSSS